MRDGLITEFSFKTIILLALGFGLIIVGGVLIGWRMSWFDGTNQIPWLTDQSWFAENSISLTFWGGAFLNVIAILGAVPCIVGSLMVLQALFRSS
jgi:hypothetical protein